MIKNILDLLVLDDWIVGDDDIDFAKGMYAIPKSVKESWKIAKRKKWQS